jgi:hypothetical protein
VTSASSANSPSGRKGQQVVAKPPHPRSSPGHAPNTGRPKLPGREYKIIERAFDPGDVMELEGWHVLSVINNQRHAHGNGYVLTLFIESDQ